MAAFEQNQQDSFNFNSELAQAKQFYADSAKVASTMNAAEMAAEEELAEQKLKNLIEQQKLRIKQLGQILALEADSIQKLASLRLTLSDKQFEARKKELQKEAQLAEKATDKQIKAENKKRSEQKKSGKKSSASNTTSSTEDIKAYTKSKTANTVQQPSSNQKEYTSDTGGMQKVELSGIGELLSSFEAQRDQLNFSVVTALNKITATEGLQSKTSIDLANELLKSSTEAEEASRKVRELNENKTFNMRLMQLNGEQKLKTEHEKQTFKNTEAKVAAFTKKRDLLLNKDLYTLEARQAHENAFYEKRNKLEEDRINAEAELAWNAANRDKLIAQNEQEARLGYLAEYQKLQADGFNHLTENLTAAEFEKLRAETEATEKAIAERSKISAASEKALATLKSKGTLAEKKQLLEAQVKERAAEKDWSKAGAKFQIIDNMSDEEKAEVQKRRENAVKAEMAVNAAMSAMANLAQQLNKQTDKIGAKQAPIDTRLQGSAANDTILGSYWKRLARDMNYIGAVNPYFTQENFASNIETLVNKGISFDIKQRAFLMTIQEKIANTFDVADGTLLRLIRIQQEDTTAGRLGMESALNSFLNSMYETSEYLTDVAASVRGSLEEMQALMEGAAGTELEFQVQKWMGSLYSVGMSQNAVQSIAQTFGQIASGDVSGLTGNGTGNLLIMAANEAGMSIADILQDGLNADETNTLMQAMVNYLAEIAETSSDSRVVQQQLANVFGMKASDLRAATNLASSIKDVSNQDLTYSGMLGQLNKMANSMILRTSTGEMLSNVWDNVQYTMATQMANDPILYLLPRVATLLEDYAGGIDLPAIHVAGFGIDLNTSVAQLMNVAALSGSILGSLGPMITGLASATSGSAMLGLAGINTSGQAPVIARGSAQPLQHLGGSSISESGLVGNASGDDVKNATLQDAEDSKKKQMVEAKEEEPTDDLSTRSQQAVIDIYNLLEEVAHGSQSLRVRLISEGFEKDNGNWVLSI